MIENELRDVLATRAGSVQDNPTRVREVHSRVAAIRRRRTAGAALALVLVTLTGLALARLPGRAETLPAGAPAGPYFGEDRSAQSVPGYRGSGYFSFRGTDAWAFLPPVPPLPQVIVASCEERGELTLRNLTGPGSQQRLSCRVPVGDHFEGALPLRTGQVVSGPGQLVPVTVDLAAGSGGAWRIGVLEPTYPQRLTAADLGRYLLDGFTSPAGGTVPVVLSSNIQFTRGLTVFATCVRGVQLRMTLAGRDAGALTCDDKSSHAYGLAQHSITERVVAGLRSGQRVTLEVRPVGPRNDQWAIIDVG